MIEEIKNKRTILDPNILLELVLNITNRAKTQYTPCHYHPKFYINDLELNFRNKRILSSLGITTFEDLINYDIDKLLSTEGMGRKAFFELQEAVIKISFRIIRGGY